MAVDELDVGLTALAAPVRDAHGDVVASVSVSGPTFRFGGLRVDELVPLLRAATAFMNEMASFESAGVSKSVR